MLTGPIPVLVDHRRMAARAQELNGSVPVARLERLCELLADNSGDAHLKIAFSRGNLGRTSIRGNVSATVALVCQNCLQVYTQTLDSHLQLTVVAGADGLDALEAEEDGIVCEGNELSVLDLLEDELLLSVPMIPRHPEECPDDWQGNEADPAPAGDTHRPFAGLADAMKNTRKD